MSFGHDALQAAWYRSRAQCECKEKDHGHPGRCTRQMIHPKRGAQTPGGWEAKRVDPARPEDGANCLLLCWPCYTHGKAASQPADTGMRRK